MCISKICPTINLPSAGMSDEVDWGQPCIGGRDPPLGEGGWGWGREDVFTITNAIIQVGLILGHRHDGGILTPNAAVLIAIFGS